MHLDADAAKLTFREPDLQIRNAFATPIILGAGRTGAGPERRADSAHPGARGCLIRGDPEQPGRLAIDG